MGTGLLPDEWAISPAPHLGDIYFTCALAEAFLRQHGGSCVKVIAPKKFWKMLTLFPRARIAPIGPASFTQPFSSGRDYRLQEPFLLQPMLHLDEFASEYRGRELPFTWMYHDLLGLPFPSFARPEISPQIRDSACRHFQESGLPEGRTVILFPLTFSLVPFPESLWSQIAHECAARGFAVATNVTSVFEFSIPRTPRLSISIDELIPICELAGTVVTARSGICDVLSSARTDLRILYQRQEVEWQPLAGVTMQWDLGPCGLEDHATYFRMGASETPDLFVDRILTGVL